MKIKLVRSDLGVAAAYVDRPEYASSITYIRKQAFWLPGSVVEVDDWGGKILVDNGDAEPADEAAEALCAGWRERRPDVLLAREMLAAGIDPEDREKFRRGEITGYDADGNYIKGPNWVDVDDDETEGDE
jgi:hypothetical protein